MLCFRKWSSRIIATWICCYRNFIEKLNELFYLKTIIPRWQLLNTPEWMIQTVKTSFLPAGKRDPRQTDGFIMPSECLRRARAFTLFISANNEYQWWDLYKHWQTHDIVITRFSHEEMKTQWEHPKTGKKKRCAGGLRIDLWTITDHLTVITVLKYLNAINTLEWSVQSFQKRVLICNEDKSMIKSLIYCIIYSFAIWMGARDRW